MSVTERFLRYVAFDTQSSEISNTTPSTEKQWELAKTLANELKEMGAQNVRLSKYCYVMAELPSNINDRNVPALGLIAHMDTSPDAPGCGVNPQIVEKYGGGVIVLSEEKGIKLDPAQFESLKTHIGEDLIVTDGITLLGADDKAGIAEIMTTVDYFLKNPNVPHGKICIAFTPDEEIGNGPERFDVSDFGADFAYTVDGGAIGEIEYENFNGANAGVFIKGKSIHPGEAKNKMINASLVAMEFAGLLPAWETPSHTEGYEGFYHIHNMSGSVEQAELHYLIRDHDRNNFERRKALMKSVGNYLNYKYGEDIVEVVIDDRYYNMRDMILPHMELIELAEKAMRASGIEPKVVPIRGGTDGARLSYMGLPCPNLCTGGHNFHGQYEYCSVQSLQRITVFLIKLVQMFAEER